MKKNIILNTLDFFAPNRCYFCQKIGFEICEECFKKHDFRIKTVLRNSKKLPDFEFYISERNGVLKQIVDDFKFENKQENYEIIAKVLAKSLLESKEFCEKLNKIALLPVPTSKNHAKERGFAHAELLAKSLSKILGVKYVEIIGRKENFTQRGQNFKVRKTQAEKSYFLKNPVKTDKIYVIFDDIKTTGATINAISKIIKNNGVKTVWAIYILQQEL